MKLHYHGNLAGAITKLVKCDIGLSPVEGEGVVNDPLGLTVEDDFSAAESRWITVGMNAGGEILVVVWTERDESERLISVRRATASVREADCDWRQTCGSR